MKLHETESSTGPSTAQPYPLCAHARFRTAYAVALYTGQLSGEFPCSLQCHPPLRPSWGEPHGVGLGDDAAPDNETDNDAREAVAVRRKLPRSSPWWPQSP